MKRITNKITILLLTLVSFVSINHCATSYFLVAETAEDYKNPIYIGVRYDLFLGTMGVCGSPFSGDGGIPVYIVPLVIIDLPLSFTLDTILLPITIPWYYLAPNRSEPTTQRPEGPERIEPAKEKSDNSENNR